MSEGPVSIIRLTSSAPRAVLAALLYAAAALTANPGAAQELDDTTRAEILALREGEMRKLTLHEIAVPTADTPFTTKDGSSVTLHHSDGKIRLLNFWATWCAPCRQEKPALDAIQADLAGPDFEVIAVATGRNAPEDIARFNDEVGITHLATYLDPRTELARDMLVLGLPVTVVLNRQGDELGRLIGGADWTSPSARAILERLIALPG